MRQPIDQNLVMLKTAVRMQRSPLLAPIRKAALMTSTHVSDRQIKFTISTEAVDRDNDTISLAGWEMTDFIANPVVLWAHNSSDLPVGKCVAIGVEGAELNAVVDFVPADMPVIGPLAEAIMRMCRDGFLSATSVGFLPQEWKIAADRMGEDDWYPALDFTKQTLMEFSVCSIPSNPEALIDPAERRAAQPTTAFLNGLQEQVIEEVVARRLAQRDEAEAARIREAEGKVRELELAAARQARLRAYRAACV